MSHFTVGVILPEGHPITMEAVEGHIAKVLAKYDENVMVEPYKDRITPELLQRWRGHNAEAVAAGTATQSFAGMTDQQLASYFMGDDVLEDEYGLYRLSTYNPDSKWDWYVVGGRWYGMLLAEEERRAIGDRVPIAEEQILHHNCKPITALLPDTQFFALVTPDGVWHEEGKMGWWGVVTEEKEEGRWQAEHAEILSGNHRCSVVLVDAHI